MHPRKILALLRKDVRDAIGDARVLLILAVPVGLGLLYGVIVKDEEPKPEATVAYVSADTTALPDVLRAVAGADVQLTFKQVGDAAEVRRLVDRKEADAGLVLPSGFDAALGGSQPPVLTLILPEGPSFGGSYAAASVDEALRRMAGYRPPATIQSELITKESMSGRTVIDQVGARRYTVLGAVMVFVVMVATGAVPIVLADEAEKKTLQALSLVMTYLDVTIAKALSGLLYIAVGVPLMLVLTGLAPKDSVTFTVAIGLFSLALVGFGLLLGSLLSATQISTWGGMLILAFLFPVFVTGISAPTWVEVLIALTPTSSAFRLVVNGLGGTAYFAHAWLSYLVIVAWAAVGYGLLQWRLARREA